MKLTIIIPIHNGYEQLKDLVENLKRQSSSSLSRVVLIDDASTDSRIFDFLTHLCRQDPCFEFHTLPKNIGFVGACNVGIAKTEGDLVILNSDTIPVEGWLDELGRVAQLDQTIGIVCPLSDNATILTMFSSLDTESRAELVQRMLDLRLLKQIPYDYFSIPTAVGFCMFVRRNMLDSVKGFDPVFGLGYGEENELSLRASQHGWKVVCAPRAFVAHIGSVSFSSVPSVDRIRRVNADALNARWPQYERLVTTYSTNDPRWFIELFVLGNLSRASGRIVVLHQTHRLGSSGGVERYVSKLIASSDSQEFTHFVLVPNPNVAHIALRRVPGNKHWVIEVPASILQHAAYSQSEKLSTAFRYFGSSFEAYFKLTIASLRPHIFHVHHLLNSGSTASVHIARNAGIPVMYGIHDFFSICPNFTLTTPSGARCAREYYDRNENQCNQCIKHCYPSIQFELGERDPYDYKSRHHFQLNALAESTLVYAPSKMVVDRLKKSFGSQLPKVEIFPINVRHKNAGRIPRRKPIIVGTEPIIAHVGAFDRLKGADTFIALKRTLERSGFRAQFWVIGTIGAGFLETVETEQIVCTHEYSEAELSYFLSRIDIACCLSSVEETYGIAIDEVVNSGVSVLLSRWPSTESRLQGLDHVHFVPPGGHTAAAAVIRNIVESKQEGDTYSADILRFDANQILNFYRSHADSTTGHETVANSKAAREYLDNLSRLGLSKHTEEMPPYAEPSLAHYGNEFFPSFFSSTPKLFCLQQDVVVLPEADLTIMRMCAVSQSAINQVSTTWLAFVEDRDRIFTREIISAIIDSKLIDDSVLILSFDDCLCSSNGVAYGYRSLPKLDSEFILGASTYDRFVAFRSIRVNLHQISYPDVNSILKEIISLLLKAHNSVHFDRCALARDDCRVYEQYRGAATDQSLTIHGATQNVYVANEHIHFVIFMPVIAPGVSLSSLANSLSGSRRTRITVVTEDNSFSSSSPPYPRVEVVVVASDNIARTIAEIVRTSHADFVVFANSLPTTAMIGFSRLAAARFSSIDIGAATTTLIDPSARIVSAGSHYFSFGLEPMSSDWSGTLINLSAPPAWMLQESSVDATGRNLCMVRRTDFESWLTQHKPECLGYRLIDEFGLHLLFLGKKAIRVEGWLIATAPTDDFGPVGLADCKLLFSRLAGDCLEPIRAKPNFRRFQYDPTAQSRPRFLPRWELHSQPTRLLVMPFDSAGSGYYRAHLPARTLQLAGHAQTFILPDHTSGFAPSVGQIIGSSVETVLAHNPFHDYQIVTLQRYRLFSRVKIVIGMDDLITQLPDYNPYAKTIYSDIEKRVKQALSLADLVVFSTEALEANLKHLCRSTMVICNFLDSDLWGKTLKSLDLNCAKIGSKPRIGWAGAPQHSADLELLRTAYNATYRKADWFFVGAQPWFSVDRFSTFVPATRPHEYPRALVDLNLDLGLAPLVDNTFNRSKSKQKALEYLASGSEVFAADLPTYHGLDIHLVDSNEDAWRAKIEHWLLTFERTESSISASKARQEVTMNNFSSKNPKFVTAWKKAISSD